MWFSGRRGAPIVLAWLVASVLAAPAAAAVDDAQAANVRRALTLLNVLREEYRESVVDGAIVKPLDYEQSKAFLAEAQERVAQAGDTTAEPDFTRLQAAVAALAPVDQVRVQIDQLHARLVADTGVQEEVFPPAPPSVSRGRAVFAEQCATCHGEAADGRGPSAAGLKPAPANFTDAAFMRQETPFDFFSVISLGKAGSPMPAWGDALSLQERWDLVSYLWTVAPGRARSAEGEGLYLAQCAGCHGATGDGRGTEAGKPLPPIAAMNTPAALSRTTDADLFAAISDGVAGTAMRGYVGTLSAAQRWSLVAFLRSLSLGGRAGWDTPAVESAGSAPARFAGLLRLLADEYGKAASATDAATRELDYAESNVLLDQMTRQAEPVLTALRERSPEVADHLRAQLDELSRAVRARAPASTVDATARAAGQAVQDQWPAAGAPQSAAALAETRRLLHEVLDAYQRQDFSAARSLLSDAYFQFEPLERRLASAAPDVTQRVESSVLELRGVLGSAGNGARAGAIVTAIERDLDDAQLALTPHSGSSTLFLQSATIILREGFEVVLLVSALLAYAVKAGSPRMRRAILAGALGGVALSVATAYAISMLFAGASGVAVEALEGLTLLLAAGVLFWVSYWLISKAEADKWQRFIQGKMQSALSRGSGIALAGVALLAVYREGVETTLFYQALLGNAVGQRSVVAGGFVAGLCALAVVYVLFIRLGVRIPMRQFFLATSAFLYYLAFVFAGSGVAELQRAGWVPLTPVPGFPQIDFIGVYPTAESLGAQAVLIVCLLYAVVVTMRQRSSESTHLDAAKTAAQRP